MISKRRPARITMICEQITERMAPSENRQNWGIQSFELRCKSHGRQTYLALGNVPRKVAYIDSGRRAVISAIAATSSISRTTSGSALSAIRSSVVSARSGFLCTSGFWASGSAHVV